MGLSSKHHVADSDYLLDRAAAEAVMADRSPPELAAIRHKLVGAYLDRVLDTPHREESGHAGTSDHEQLEMMKTIFSQLPASTGSAPSDQDAALYALLRKIP